MTTDYFTELIVALLVAAVVGITRTMIKHGQDIVELRAMQVPEAVVRNIVERSVQRLHDDHTEFKHEVRDGLSKLSTQVETVRIAVGKSRSTD